MRAITILCLFLVAQCWAQPSYLAKHTLPPNTVIRSSDLAADGGVVLAGGIDDDLTYINRLDAAGNSTWLKALDVIRTYGGFGFTQHEPAYAIDVACLPDGSIIVAGEAGETDPDLSQFATRHFVLLDNIGEVLVDRTEYYPIRAQNWQGVLPLSDGTILFSGADHSLNLSFGYLMVYDPGSDQILTSKRYYRTDSLDDYTADGFRSVVALSTGGFVGIGGDYVVQLSTDLQPLWHIYFDALGLVDVCEASNGSVVLSWPDKLMRLTASGVLEWAVSIPQTLGTIAALRAGPDGSAHIAGTGPDGSIWWGEVDMQGDLVWQEQWGEPGVSFALQGMHHHPDGRLSLVAQATGAQPTVAVLTTDTTGRVDGCTVPGPTPPLDIASIAVLPYGYSFSDLPSGMYDAQSNLIEHDPIYTLVTEQCASGFGRLSGTVYHDVDADGTQGPDDATLDWQPVLVVPDSSYAYSTLQGYEVDLLSPGTRTFSLVHNDAIWGLSAGAGGHVVEITQVDTIIAGLDFGLFALLDTTIVQSALSSAPTRCSLVIPQTINVLNQGTTAPDLMVAITMDPLITFVGSVPAPDSIAGDTIYWYINGLSPFQQASIALQMLMPDFNYIDTVLQATLRCFEMPDGGGLMVLAAEHLWSSVLLCAFDPNDKIVEPEGTGPEGHIPVDTEWLTYTVRFQNTGTDTAHTVIIRDQLSSLLQRSTLEVLATSHPLTQMTISSGGLATFRFEQILLPDSGTNEQASHGHVRFRIRPQAGLAHGTVIPNTAGIYFDLNPAVITNTVLNTIENCVEDTMNLEVVLVDDLFHVTGDFPFGLDVWDFFGVTWFLNGEPLPEDWDQMPVLPGEYSAVLFRWTTECEYEVGPYLWLPTGVGPERTTHMTIAPNPFTDQLMIHIEASCDHIELVDVNGRVLRSQSTGNSPTVLLDRGGLASGIYLLRLMEGTAVVATARVLAQ